MRKLSLIILAFMLFGYSNSFAQASKLRVMITPYDSLHATLMVVDTVVSIGDTTYFLDFTKFLGGSSLNFVDSSGVSGTADTILVTIPFPQIQNYADTLSLRLLLTAFADSVASIDSTYITNNSLGFEDINNLVTVLATKMFSSAFVDSLNNTHTITSDWTYSDSVSIDTLSIEGLINIDSTEIPNDNIGFEDVNNLPEIMNLKTDSSDVISLIAGSLSVYTPTLALDESLATKFPLNTFGDSTAAIDSTYITNDKLGFEDVNNLPEIMNLKMPLSSFGDSTGAIDSTYITDDALGFEDVNNLSSIMTSKTDSGETSALIGDSLSNYPTTVETKALISDSLQVGTADSARAANVADSAFVSGIATNLVEFTTVYGDSIIAPSTVSQESLAAYFPFNDTFNEYVNGNHGINNGSTLIDSGQIYGAIDFDGSSFVNIDDVLTNELASTQVGSIEFWANPDDITPSSTERFMGFGDTNGLEEIQIFIKSGTGLLIMQVRVAGVIQWALQTDANPFVLGKYCHIEIVQNGISPVIYINGVLVQQTFTTSTDVTAYFADATGLDNGRIASLNFNSAGESGFLNGVVDEVKFSKRAHSVVEVKQNHLNSKHFNEKNTAADKVQFEDVTTNADVNTDSTRLYTPRDSNAKDYSGNGNHGTDTDVIYGPGDVAGNLGNYNGTTSNTNHGSDASIDDIWDGGGWISLSLNANSDGEGNAGRILDKRGGASIGWTIFTQLESGGFVSARLIQNFDGASGDWNISNVPINQLNHLVIVYDADAVGNDPTIYLNTISKTVTETSTPVGTRQSDASNDLFAGNRSNGAATFDGGIGELRMGNGDLTQADVDKLFLNAKHLHDMQVAVDLNATETIGGVKTFSDSSHFDGNVVIDSNLVVNGGFDLNPAFIHVFTTDSVGVTVTTANDEVHLANTFAVGNAGSSQFTLLTDSLKYTGTDSIIVAVEIDLGSSISQANQHAQWKLFHNSAAIGDEIFIGRDFSSAGKVGVVSMHGHVRLGMNDVLYIIATVTTSDGKTLGHEHVMFSVLEIKKIIQ